MHGCGLTGMKGASGGQFGHFGRLPPTTPDQPLRQGSSRRLPDIEPEERFAQAAKR